MLYIPADNRAC